MNTVNYNLLNIALLFFAVNQFEKWYTILMWKCESSQDNQKKVGLRGRFFMHTLFTNKN